MVISADVIHRAGIGHQNDLAYAWPYRRGIYNEHLYARDRLDAAERRRHDGKYIVVKDSRAQSEQGHRKKLSEMTRLLSFCFLIKKAYYIVLF